MASTVPGVDREGLAAKLGIGVQAPDLTSLAAPTISLTPTAPGLKLGQLRRTGKADRAVDASPISGDTFAATLAKTIAARKTANEQASRMSRPSRVEARQEREHAVRDVVRQLKQLVDSVRDAARDAAREAKGPSGTPPQQAGQTIAHRELEVDETALRSAFERLTGTTTDASPAAGEDPSLAQPANVEALLQTVADAIAQAMTPEGEIDETALAASLLADPLVLAAAEALIAALQVQLVTAVPVALPAAQTDGDTAAGEATGSTDAKALTAAQPGAVSVSEGSSATNGSPTPGATVEAPSAPAASAPAATPIVADQSNTAGVLADAEAIVAAVQTSPIGESSPTPVSTVQPAVETAPSAAPVLVDLAAIPSDATVVVESTQAVTTGSVEDPEAAALTAAAPAVVESDVAAITASAGDSAEVNAPASTSGDPAPAILAQTASGQTGALADTAGQSFGEGDATIEAAAAVRLSASAQASSGADADGAVPSGQSAAASVQSAGSGLSAGANSTPTSNTNPATSSAVTPSGTPGNAAPAARAEGVTQPQGAQDGAPNVELHEQVSPVIVRQARLISGNGGHELTVRLNPDHLGPLHVRISLLDGALSVGLTAANSEAQRALENALPQLRGALVESGLRLDRLDVSQRDAGGAGNGGQSGNQRGSANAGRNGGQSGYAGNEGRQSNAGAESNGNASFADVLLDQDGRAFGTAASRGARWLGYRAYRRG